MSLEFSQAYRDMGVPGGLPAEKEPGFAAWYDLLVRWNKKTNLTRVVAPGQVVAYHLLDSLPLAKFIPDGVTLLDVGSGPGVPGLVVAALRPDVNVVCCESITKKAAFLIQARSLMQLPNVRVENARAEDLGETFDVITARAVAGPESLVADFGGLLIPGGVLACFVTPRAKYKIPEGYRVVKTNDYELPGGFGSRRLVWVARPVGDPSPPL